MSAFKTKKLMWYACLLSVSILVVAALWFGAQAMQTHAQEGEPGPDSGAPQAGDAGPHACTIVNIAAFETRIHVRCASPATVGPDDVYYFAASADGANTMSANRYLALLNTAYALSKPVYVYYDSDSSSNPPGCNTNDCRGISWIYIVP